MASATKTRPVSIARGDELPGCPGNLNAEKSVLGAIILDNTALGAAMSVIRAGDFFLPENQIIFSCALKLTAKFIPIDLVTLLDELTRTGELDRAGGGAYVGSLTDGVPRVTNVLHYARIVKRAARLRQLAQAAEEIQREALTYRGEDADSVLALAAERIAALCGGTGVSVEPSAWRELFHSFADFENCAPLSFSIGGFLQNDGATMVGGLSGHGKTLILCSIAKALLAGRGSKLWDLFPVEENCLRVVYLVPECSLAPFKHRLQLFGLYSYLAPNDERLLVRTLSKGPTPCLSDPRILFSAKGAHVILDTAVRFAEGDENNATEVSRGLANDIFALLASGARSVIAAHHSPKPFARENRMTLENVLRGSGDVGAMLTTAWGVKQIDSTANILHIENIKPRDFQPCGPFQISGRPSIDETGDFRILKRPGECGSLCDEQEPQRDRGGAPKSAREGRAANVTLMRKWLEQSPHLTSQELVRCFASVGIKVNDSTIRHYRKELRA